MNEKKIGIETMALHAGYEVDRTTMSRAVPLYMTTSYLFKNTQHAANLFALSEEGNIYTRLMNPTTDVFEKRMAALEGGVGAVAFSSGMAAITGAILNIARAGQEIVSSTELYGGTGTLFTHSLPKMGIKVNFVKGLDPAKFKSAITEKTRLVFIEAIGNPGLDVPDFAKIAEVAHAAGIPLLVDATFATPVLCRPIEHGADVVIHSATKWIGGHGVGIGGVVIDAGKFNYANGKFPELSEPDPSYHGIRYTEAAGELAYIIKLRVQVLRDTGACISPFNAFLALQGIETLPLRMRRHVENAVAVARMLAAHPAVAWVRHPSLPDHPSHKNAARYFPDGAGAVLGFGVRGGLENGKKFIDALKLVSHLANVGDAKTLAIHPASTTHQQLTPDEQAAAGVSPDFIRLSVGIETLDDIIADIRQALDQSQA